MHRIIHSVLLLPNHGIEVSPLHGRNHQTRVMRGGVDDEREVRCLVGRFAAAAGSCCGRPSDDDVKGKECV